jgi:PAS domain S-box-containing protein
MAQAGTSALKPVLGYAVFAGLWILFSDRAVGLLFNDPQQIVAVSTLKGWLFVAVTSLLLYGLIRRQLKLALNLSLREREAQEEKSRTSQLLSAISDSSSDAIFAKDLEGRYLMFNREVERVSCKPGKLHPGCRDSDVFPPDQVEILRANDCRVIEEGAIKTYEECISTVDGERTFLATKGPLRDEGGKIIGVFGISRDITERKRAEYDLRTLSRAMEQSPSSIVITDRAGFVKYVNPRFEEVTGYSKAEAIGAKPSILKSGVTPDETYAELWKAISEGGDWRGELCNRKNSGELFWEFASISGIKGEDGAIEHYIAVKEDVTARKLAEQALERESHRNRVFLRNASDGVHILDADGIVLEVSDSFCEMLGYTREELIGAHISLWDQTWSREELKGVVMEQILNKGRSVFETRHRRRDGSHFCVEVTGHGLELDGRPALFNSARDITERKRLEEAHLRAQKLESLGTLTGGIAHDFNNILTAIRGNAELAAQDVGPAHAAAQSLDEIRKAGARASELVRRITAFGRPRDTRPEAVDLGAVVDEVLKLLRSTLPAGISLSTNFDAGTPHVMADAGQVHEAIVNLTTNAAYAIGPRAGTIEYRLEPAQVDQGFAHSVAGLEPGRYARLAVADSGSGMHAATMERIFDAFFTTKPVGEGAGLGLSMVHGIMKSHRGAILVSSTPGAGSSFALYFPAADGPAPAARTSAALERPSGTARRILYVDDEPALASLARRMLSRQGHQVSSFTDPVQALEHFRAQSRDYDVVVTDLSMPHMSGFDLVQALRVLRPALPAILTTGNLGSEDEARARAAGIREIVLKPVLMDALGAALDRLFRDSATENS